MGFRSAADFSSVIDDEILNVSSVGGGDIGSSYLLETRTDRLFVKRYSNSGQPGMEARGLEAMAATRTVTVPEVINFDEHFLVLRYIEQAPRCRDFQEQLGRGLARMHKVSAEDFNAHRSRFGWNEDNYIGSVLQKNGESDSWTDFYIEKRIGFQVRLAGTRALSDAWEELRRRIPELLSGTEEPPSLIHGDLWGGNVISGRGGTPVLIDPAAYYGHREMELGMTMLFGGFTARFYEAYDSEYPLKPGWRSRMNLYILYHVLNHCNMFGGGYCSQALGLMKGFK